MRWIRLQRILLAATTLCIQAHFLLTHRAAAQVTGVTIDVAADQRVSASGRSISVRTTVEDVCYRAGVEVLSWDAEDRTFGGSYTGLPLQTFLQRLLREESYLVETVRIGGAERVTTLRVLGDPAVAAARRARGEGGYRAGFRVPPALLSTAFGKAADSGQQQKAALEMLGARISGNPTQLQGFLATDSRLIAEALARHGNVEAGLRELQQRYPDPRITAKIDEILQALASPP